MDSLGKEWKPRRTDFKLYSGGDVVRLTASFLLIFAAAAKAYQLAFEPPSTAIITSRGFILALIALELMFGFTLLLNCTHRAIWVAAGLFFVILGSVSFHAAWAGARSCGCFGPVAISPWLSASLSFSIVGGFLAFEPPVWAPCHPCRLLTTLLLTTLGTVAAVIAASTYQPRHLSIDGTLAGRGSTVLVDTTTWLERPCPILPYIRGAEKLDIGTWTLVFYRHGCSRCTDTVMTALEQHRDDVNTQQLALIEVPTRLSVDKTVYFDQAIPAAQATLTDSLNWSINVPTIVILHDARVTYVGTQLPQMEWSHARRQ